MPFLRFCEERNYTFRVSEIIAQYVDISSSNLPATSWDFLAFDKPPDRLNIYIYIWKLITE